MQQLPEVFRAEVDRVGLILTSAAEKSLKAGAQWLAASARASGISQYSDPEQALLRAMGPALSYFAVDRRPLNGHAADLGSGNGAIGATVALLAPDLQVDLVDRAKRAYTVSEVLVARLGISNVQPIHSDIRALTATYDAILYRALAPGTHALQLALPRLARDGLLCAFHHAGDDAYEHTAVELQVHDRVETLVPDLILTCYRR